MSSSSDLPEPWTDSSSLLRDARAGEAEAVHALAMTLGTMARRFFLGKGFAVPEAEAHAVTCVTETWLRLARFRGGNFPGWVHTVFLRLLIDELRRRRRVPPLVLQ